MQETELKEAVLLLAKAIERVTVNTYVEQGSVGADEVFRILGQVEKICGNEEVKVFNFQKEETAEKHFTPEEVRKMSPREVRDNYTAILKSMEKWN